MAKFNITIRKYTDETITVDAADKISAHMAALAQIQKADSEYSYEIIGFTPVNDPIFNISDIVKTTKGNKTGVVMKRAFSEYDNTYVYKVLCDNPEQKATFETFFEHELTKKQNGELHH